MSGHCGARAVVGASVVVQGTQEYRPPCFLFYQSMGLRSELPRASSFQFGIWVFCQLNYFKLPCHVPSQLPQTTIDDLMPSGWYAVRSTCTD